MGRGFLELAQYYQVGEKVGEGRCGVSVRRCVERSTGRAYACKSTPKSMLLEPRKVDALRTEVAILEMLQGSPGIVQLHQVLEEPQVRRGTCSTRAASMPVRGCTPHQICLCAGLEPSKVLSGASCLRPVWCVVCRRCTWSWSCARGATS